MFKIKQYNAVSMTATSKSTLIIMMALILLSQCFTHSAYAQQQNDIQINYIEAPETATEGDELLIRWDVSGVDSIYLHYGASPDSPHDHRYDYVSNVGEMRVPASHNSYRNSGYRSFNMFFSFHFGEENIIKTTHVGCPHEVFFLKPRESWHSCPYAPTVSQASMQQFENGFMLWVGANDEIIVLPDDAGANDTSLFWIVNDNFEHGRDPISDPTIAPPPGKYQPEYGFGKVWSEVEGVRDSLGWAISSPIDYETVIQSFDDSTYSPEFSIESRSRFWRLPDGSVLREVYYHDYAFGTGPSHSLTVNRELDGYAHPNNGIRIPQTDTPIEQNEESSNLPQTDHGAPCPTSGVWPAGCNPNVPTSTDTSSTNGNGVPCPTSGVWPAGCNPNLPSETTTTQATGQGQPCPTSGVWPAGCVPGGSPSTPPTDPSACVIPASGPWPDCATAGDPSPANTPSDCIIPPSGPWPPCATGSY